ncbi:alpha/beta hydrolase [Streptomyces violaceoruber]|uniref:alpha/beta hydrolase n=1 Tax=Streptomyces violaceoruber TaxID=1935 RepID=UPI00403C2DAB
MTTAPRPFALRLRRALLGLLAAAAVAGPVVGAASPVDVPAPRPTAPATLNSIDSASLQARYAATLRDIEAARRTAADFGNDIRAAALEAMTTSGRHFLTFDGRDGGRAVEVYGDLSRAERIAVLVPGADVTVDNYWRLRAGAKALRKQLPPGSAVIAWLGYRTPTTVSLASANTERGSDAAHALSAFLRQLGSVLPEVNISLLCHSYGTVVCAHAASRSDARDIILCGSPGTGYDDVGAMHTRATVWAGRGSDDWVAHVPHLRLELGLTEIGLCTDPLSSGFGATRFDAGDGGHSDYLKPGSVSLRNIALIIAGQSPVRSSSGEHLA